jgi:hypothetical protein
MDLPACDLSPPFGSAGGFRRPRFPTTKREDYDSTMTQREPSPGERFESLAKRLLAVPKAQVDEAEKKRPKRRRRKPA